MWTSQKELGLSSNVRIDSTLIKAAKRILHKRPDKTEHWEFIIPLKFQVSFIKFFLAHCYYTSAPLFNLNYLSYLIFLKSFLLSIIKLIAIIVKTN